MPALNTVTAPPAGNPLNSLAYAEETRNAAGLSASGGIFQLTQGMWEQYAPSVGIDTGLAPTPASASGVEQRAVAAAIYNQYGFTPFETAHPGITSRLPTTPQQQTVPIWGGTSYLTQLLTTPEGNFFDPFGVGASNVPDTAVGSSGSAAGLTYATGQPITAGATLTGVVPATGNTTSSLLPTTYGGSLGSSGGDPFANIPQGYSEPSTGDTSTPAPSSGGLSGLAAGVLTPVVTWAEGHLVMTAIIVLVVGGFAAYHGLLGPKFETFVHRFV